MVWETDRQSFARFSACRCPKHGHMYGLRDRQAEFCPFQRLTVRDEEAIFATLKKDWPELNEASKLLMDLQTDLLDEYIKQ